MCFLLVSRGAGFGVSGGSSTSRWRLMWCELPHIMPVMGGLDGSLIPSTLRFGSLEADETRGQALRRCYGMSAISALYSSSVRAAIDVVLMLP